jgi:nicotinamide-nucleotide amidase
MVLEDEKETQVSGFSQIAYKASRVGFLAIGDEIVSARIRETNSSLLARLLPGTATLEGVCLVPDDPQTILGGLRFLNELGCTVIVTSGGLGPTADDQTRAALAAFLGVSLEWSEEAWANVERAYVRSGNAQTVIPEANRRQGYLPYGTRALDNPWGTACGMLVENPLVPRIVCLPGVPREFSLMLSGLLNLGTLGLAGNEVGAQTPSNEFSCQLFGLGESAFESDLWAHVISREVLEHYSICARSGLLEVRLRFQNPNDFQPFLTHFLHCFGDRLISRSLDPLPAQILQICRARGLKLGLVESCTGGALAHQLSRIPGASAVLEGALVTYDRAAKARLLGLEPSGLVAEGVYAMETAGAMATAGLDRLACDWVVSTTGVAGPGPDSAGVGEGVVRVACACRPEHAANLLVCADALKKMFRSSVQSVANAVVVDVKLRPSGDKEDMILRMCQAAWVILMLGLQAVQNESAGGG